MPSIPPPLLSILLSPIAREGMKNTWEIAGEIWIIYNELITELSNTWCSDLCERHFGTRPHPTPINKDKESSMNSQQDRTFERHAGPPNAESEVRRSILPWTPGRFFVFLGGNWGRQIPWRSRGPRHSAVEWDVFFIGLILVSTPKFTWYHYALLCYRGQECVFYCGSAA